MWNPQEPQPHHLVNPLKFDFFCGTKDSKPIALGPTASQLSQKLNENLQLFFFYFIKDSNFKLMDMVAEPTSTFLQLILFFPFLFFFWNDFSISYYH